ncbi:MAG TPA: RES family NAD+ phosphorylase [Steroidobacteraceae bacterium]|jgi:hypothetical protein|nr:RES family NAD+ phosphorylase [Steroidobacteraceae bacterium]
MTEPAQVSLHNAQVHRIIPSQFPPINIFERVVEPGQLDAAWYLESLTNDRLREQAGDLHLISEEDRVCGRGSSIVMAAFTHIGRPSRFSNGVYGVYYAARSLKTAVYETVYHRQRFLAATDEAPGELDMRAFTARVRKPMRDIRAPRFKYLHDPDDYTASQEFGKQRREKNDWGLVYNSVRDPGGTCVAIFRPPAISIPVQGAALAYVWDGKRITSVYQKAGVLFEL